jgi:hypothetical protein
VSLKNNRPGCWRYQSPVAERLRKALTDGEWRRMIRLPKGRLVALFVDEAKLCECL